MTPNDNVFIARIKYLMTRTIIRPERVVSAVSNYHPYVDVIVTTMLCMMIVALFSEVSMARRILYEGFNAAQSLSRMAESSIGFGLSLAAVMVYAASASISAMMLGGKAKLVDTALCFILFTSISLALASPLVAVLKLVDFEEPTTRVTESLISVGPWLYAVFLFYVAVLKIHRTLPPRAIAYMGIASLPLILIYALLRWELQVSLPLGLM